MTSVNGSRSAAITGGSTALNSAITAAISSAPAGLSMLTPATIPAAM